MRVLRSVVGSFVSEMLDAQAKFSESGPVGSELVGNQARWHQLLLEKLAHELFRSLGVGA